MREWESGPCDKEDDATEEKVVEENAPPEMLDEVAEDGVVQDAGVVKWYW